MGKDNVFKNTLTLTLSGILAKTIDFLFRTYYIRKLGVEGSGLLSLVLSVYSVFLILASCSVSSAVSKLVSEQIAKKNYGEVKVIVRAAIKGVFFASFFVILFASFFIDFFSLNILKDPRTKIPLLCLLPSIMFMGISYCLKAYFYSFRKIIIPASSEFLEQFVKIISISINLFFLLPKGIEYGLVAVFSGISIGEASSFIYLFCFYIFDEKKLPDKKTVKNPYIRLLKIAVPDTGGTLFSSYLQTLEELLFLSGLEKFGFTRKEALLNYGAISGMALPLTVFPLNLLSSFLTLLVPEVSRAANFKTKERLRSILEKVFKFSAYCSFLVSTVLFLHAKELSVLFYNNKNISGYVTTLCVIIPITLYDSVSHRILMGLSKEKLLFFCTATSAVLRTLLTYFLAPKMGAFAIIISIYLGSLYSFFIKLIAISALTDFEFNFFSFFLLPLFASVSSVILSTPIIRTLSSKNLIIKLSITTVTFTIFIFIFKVIKKAELMWVKERIKN